MVVNEHWYREAVVYSLNVETFADSDGDGIGDFRGLTGRLDYLSRLGVTCLWLSPIHPSPRRDGGYDVTDFYAVDPRLGTLGDFAELLHAAQNRGLRVIIDLVVNHTSDEHPWFRAACADPGSPYRNWYVWSDNAPSDRFQGMVFPGAQAETWTYSRKAKAWFYHRFYDFQPDLNTGNPEVRAELKRIMAFWLQLGVAGFRIDAAPFIIEQTQPDNPNSPKDFGLLTELREHASLRRGDALLLAEANAEPGELVRYFGDEGGSANRLHMLFDFMLNGRIMLALARREPESIIEGLKATPGLPAGAQWATFLRNHDEVDLSRLTADQRADVFAEFGPDPAMQLYDRGIRRRMATMLGGDADRIRMAYSLQFTLRGTPVLRYGEEIGMGDNLALPEREAIRTPMQWSALPNGGFTSGPDPVLPVITGGPYGFETTNVTAQRHDATSLLAWFERMIHTLRECPEVGAGSCTVLDEKLPPGVLAHRADGPTGSMVFLHNLGDQPCEVDLGALAAEAEAPNQIFGTQLDDPVGGLDKLRLDRYGYRWIRLRRHSAGWA